MKTMLVLMICMFSYLALAERSGEKVEDVKASLTTHLDERISHLQKVKSCVASAKDQAALKVCRQDMKEHRQGMKEKWKTKRAERKSKQKSE